MTRIRVRATLTAAVGLVVLLAGIVGGLVALERAERRAEVAERAEQRVREDAFVVGLAAIHDVDPAQLDRAAALAGGRNACHLIHLYHLDPVSLAGWREYWRQPWEGRWLRLSVDLLCPPGGGGRL
ncbi:MAG TPA: hypothetical protein VF062_15430 [Candidatus Limnocylindrales bacterium]